MVYIIEANISGEIFYKIGFTKVSAKARLKQLQTSCPVPLRILKEFPGGLKDEKRLHAYLDCLKTSGEWFKHGPLIEQFLKIPPGNPIFNNRRWVKKDGKYTSEWLVPSN